MCFVSAAIPCPLEYRTILLSVIAECTKLTVEDVDHPLMNGLSVSTNILIAYGQLKFLCWCEHMG